MLHFANFSDYDVDMVDPLDWGIKASQIGGTVGGLVGGKSAYQLGYKQGQDANLIKYLPERRGIDKQYRERIAALSDSLISKEEKEQIALKYKQEYDEKMTKHLNRGALGSVARGVAYAVPGVVAGGALGELSGLAGGAATADLINQYQQGV